MLPVEQEENIYQCAPEEICEHELSSVLQSDDELDQGRWNNQRLGGRQLRTVVPHQETRSPRLVSIEAEFRTRALGSLVIATPPTEKLS